MELALIIKVAIGVVAFVAWLIGKIKGPVEQAPMAATPPPAPRRTRRVRNAPPPLAPEPEAPAPVPVVAPHLDATSLVVTRPARAQARTQFRGSAALRQAVVAREVLGLPLALRPPRL